jgi:hypothetical protein
MEKFTRSILAAQQADPHITLGPASNSKDMRGNCSLPAS